jgi:NADPH2:quinone reductase
MKAIRVREFGGPEVMRLEDAEIPRPGTGQVMVKVHAAGVNPVDTYIRSGTYAVRPDLPYTPGMDAAGTVASTGEGVRKVKAGDRVYVSRTLSGSYAEETLCLESQVHPLPSHISFPQGTCLGVPYAAAYKAIFQRAKALPGEVLLVHGASGGVGIAAVQFGRAAGMRVIATAGTKRGRDLASGQGAHEVFDHHSPGHFREILESTGDKGVDVIIELLANVNLGNDLTILAKSGRVVVVGSRGTVEVDPREAMRRDASVLGMVLFNATDHELSTIHAAIGAGLETGTLRPFVGKEMPLSEAARAHHEIIEESAFGKIVLIP